MSQKTFCDKCDQELVIPDEKVDFISGQPTSGKGDICWLCRLREIVEMYNEKTKDMNDRPRAILRWSPPTPHNTPTFVYDYTLLGKTNAEP